MNSPFFLTAFRWQVIVVSIFIIFTGCNTADNVNLSEGNIVRLDSLFNSAIENHKIPGAVVHISFKGNEIYHQAFGYRSVEKKVALKTNDIFRLASMNKGLTAVAILQLAEKKLLDLDDYLYTYIPAFKTPQILLEVLPDSTFTSKKCENEITIRQLLTHTSGIGYGFQDDNYNALVIKNAVSEGFCEDERTSLENTKKIAKLPLLCEPGTRNIYSMSYDVLGTLIEVVSKQRYDKYIDQNILSPLEMEDSFFIVPKEYRKRLPNIYQPDRKGGIIPTTYADINYPIADDKQFFSGGADLCGTAKDYEKFVAMIRSGGTLDGVRILGEEYVAMMLAKQTNLVDGDSDQGFAAWVVNEQGEKNGLMSQGSYGFGGFFDTYSWTDPNRDFIATLFLQMYPTNEIKLHEKYQKLVYEIIQEL